VVRHQVLVLAFGGSNPSAPAMRLFNQERCPNLGIFLFGEKSLHLRKVWKSSNPVSPPSEIRKAEPDYGLFLFWSPLLLRSRKHHVALIYVLVRYTLNMTKGKQLLSYPDVDLKIPEESDDYPECSEFLVKSIDKIMRDAMDTGRNKIVINTNLKLGIPMENVNKVAGPFIEAWAHEVFQEAADDLNNPYKLVNVEAGERLNMADIILQFKKKHNRSTALTSYVDVKATSNDIPSSGKSPNITSYSRIRTAYVEDPDYIFIILSIKHKVFSTRNDETKMMMGVMEIIDFNAYDLKYISAPDISYNPALGTGQIQIKDIHYVSLERRTSWEFCQLLDKKFLASKKGFDQWLSYARANKWIKE
jgi:hypothetical protein